MPGGEVIELIANAGFDFAVVDLEHSQLSYEEVRLSLHVARATGLDIVVRIPTLDAGLANRLIEAGAAGIQLSTVRSGSTARRFEQSLRYAPVGTRSISLTQPRARFGATPLCEYLEQFSEDPLIVGQLETAEYDDDLVDIVSPLDVAFIGSLDLSVAAGTPGDHTSPDAAKVIDSIVDAARQTHTLLGIVCTGPVDAETAAAAGINYITVGTDVGLLRAATAQLVNDLRSAVAR
nr:aldolase/citrate lyase family protein [Rhodococcus sp. 15-1154-1]